MKPLLSEPRYQTPKDRMMGVGWEEWLGMNSKTNRKCLKFPIVLKIKCIPMILLRTNTQLLFEAGSTQVHMQKLDNFLRVTLRYTTQGKMRDCPLEAGQPSHSESCVISWESYILRSQVAIFKV